MDRASLFSFKPEPAKLDNGQTVYLRRITSAERLEWLTLVRSSADGDDAALLKVSADHSSRLLCLTLCDESGKRLFADGEEKDVAQTVDAITADRLADEAMRVNALSGKEAEKNSPAPASAA